MTRALVICILAMATTAYAEKKYKIHPTDGEFTKTPKGCGQKTKDELFERIIAKVPILVIDKKGDMQIELGGGAIFANETIGDTGWWYYVGKQTTKTMVISLEPQNKRFRVISIGIIRRMDDIECSEKWVGIVEVPRGS